MTESELATALSTLATGLGAGMSPLALVSHDAGRRTLPPRLRAALERSLQAGDGIAAGFGAARALDDADQALLVAGEHAGLLPQTLQALADALHDRRQQRRKLALALAYPMALAGLAGLVLPLPLLVTDGAAAYGRAATGPVLTVVVIAALGLVVVPRLAPRSPLRALLMRCLLWVPLLGSATRRGLVAGFAQTLGRLVAAGLPVTTALRAALPASRHPRLVARAPRVLRTVDEGGTLAQALEAAGAFDDPFLGRVAQAELTGTLDVALAQLADEARGQSRSRTLAFIGALGVLTFLLVAAAVGLTIVRGAQGYVRQIDMVTDE